MHCYCLPRCAHVPRVIVLALLISVCGLWSAQSAEQLPPFNAGLQPYPTARYETSSSYDPGPQLPGVSGFPETPPGSNTTSSREYFQPDLASPSATESLPAPLPSFSTTPMAPPAGGTPGGVSPSDWVGQALPEGLIWRSYLAGVKEPRFSLVTQDNSRFGTMWDGVLGGRVSLFRYGTMRAYRPEGWEVQLEGAAIPRLKPFEDSSPLVSCDYRVGAPIVYGRGKWQYKTGYTHLSSHLGDEWMILHPNLERINYVRDSIMFGVSYYHTDDLRLYAEMDYAFVTTGGAEPFEFQFGADWSPAVMGRSWFAACYGDLRQELDYGGYFVVQAGAQWRGGAALHTFRLGVQYLNGLSPQFEFFNQFEQSIGFGLWYDY